MGTLNVERKFIFIHIPKNAGLSMDKVLNCHGGHVDIHEYKYWVNQGKITGLRWKGLKKFAFVRNPYDRFRSIYRYFVKRGQIKCSFSEFAESFKDMEFIDYEHTITRPQHTFICDEHNHNILVDFVGRFENIDDDWKKAMTFIGIPPVKLPKVNIGDHSIKAIYTKEIVEVVKEYYKFDFEIFNYNTE